MRHHTNRASRATWTRRLAAARPHPVGVILALGVVLAVLTGAAGATSLQPRSDSGASAHTRSSISRASTKTSTKTSTAATAGKEPPYEPIVLQKIGLPSSMKEASDPIFTLDGEHLLFFDDQHMWIVGTNGKGLKCLTCGQAVDPLLEDGPVAGMATEFPDGKRVFFGAILDQAVLECTPSVIDCEKADVLPVNLTGARPTGGIFPPGGSDSLPGVDLPVSSSPKLSPDGDEVAFGDLDSDVGELMVIAKLTRTPTEYVASDPRILNPEGPTSLTDGNTLAWSDSAAEYEFKSFADGGADATYLQVGGANGDNPDAWEMNLATGKRWRITSGPDWDEDSAPDPTGQSIIVESDRTMHRTDSLGLMPFRDFISVDWVLSVADYYVGSNAGVECDLQPWLLPASGDDDAHILGQPLDPYNGGEVHADNNINGYPMWDPNGTQLALNTDDYETGLAPPYLTIAHLVSRKPKKPIPIVDSYPGNWAATLDDYHGVYGTLGEVTLHGLASGTVTVDYDSPGGILSGSASETYDHYSDNGYDFVNGTVDLSYPDSFEGSVTDKTDLTLTGRDTGYSHVDLTLTGATGSADQAEGSAVSNFDGATETGLAEAPKDCPQTLPHIDPTKLTLKLGHRRGHKVIIAHVTASIYGSGLTETQTDTRPMTDATIALGDHHVHTNAAGMASLSTPYGRRRRVRLTETAGDTFRRSAATITVPRLAKPKHGSKEHKRAVPLER